MIIKIEKKRSRKIKFPDGEQFFSAMDSDEFEVDENKYQVHEIVEIKIKKSCELDEVVEQMLENQIRHFIKMNKKKENKDEQ